MDECIPSLKGERTEYYLSKNKKYIEDSLAENKNLDCQKLFLEGKEKYASMYGKAYHFETLFTYLRISCELYKTSSAGNRIPKFYEEDKITLLSIIKAFNVCFEQIGIYGFTLAEAYDAIMSFNILNIDNSANVDVVPDIPTVKIYSLPYFIDYLGYRENIFTIAIHSAEISYNREFLDELESKEINNPYNGESVGRR